MSQHDSPLNQQMLGSMGGGNGGLDAAWGQMAASMAEDNRRMREFTERHTRPTGGTGRSLAPSRPLTPEERRAAFRVYGWLGLFVLITLLASDLLGFRFMWGFCAMLAIKTMLWFGTNPDFAWLWGKYFGLVLLACAGALITTSIMRLTKLILRMLSAAARKAWSMIVQGLQTLGRLVLQGLVNLIRGLRRQFKSKPQAS